MLCSYRAPDALNRSPRRKSCCCIMLGLIAVASSLSASPLKFDTFDLTSETEQRSVTAQTPSLLAEQLVQASGLEQLFELIPGAIENGLYSTASSEDTGVYPDIRREELTAQINRAFSQPRLRKTVSDSLAADLSMEQMSSALEFLISPLGTKIVQQEVERSAIAHEGQFDAAGKKNPTDGLDSDRGDVLSELDQAWGITQANVDMLIDMQIAMTVAMMPALPTESQTDVLTLSERARKQRPHLLEYYKEDTLNTLFFVYANLTTNEIRQYIRFAKSAAGAPYVKAMTRGHKKAMLEGSFLWGRELGQAIGKSRGLSL